MNNWRRNPQGKKEPDREHNNMHNPDNLNH